MAWNKPHKGGWSATAADEPVSRFTQIIRTIISVVPGGCIRYGKDGPNDDGHTGFWLGVDAADSLAKFSIGGRAFWLKWTGTELLVRGRISTLAGDQGSEPVQWIGADGQPVATMYARDAWGHWLTVDVPRADAAGDPAMIDLQADGDFGAALRLRLMTEKGTGKVGTKALIQVGNGTVFSVDGLGNVWAAGVISAQNVGGWSGSFRTDEIAVVTVQDGRIVGVA